MSCRKLPPRDVCVACGEANGGCKQYCRDAFIYRTDKTPEELADDVREARSRSCFIEEAAGGLKMPAAIAALL